MSADNVGHKWTIFVKFANENLNVAKLITKVRFGLDDSYITNYVDIKQPKENGSYEKSFAGWDTWTVPITINFKGEGIGRDEVTRVLELQHELSFEGEGKWQSTTLQLKKSVAKKLNLGLE